MRIAVVLVCVFAAVCNAAPDTISHEEAIPAFRQGVDDWRSSSGVRGEWRDNMLVVSVSSRDGFVMDYSRYPGMKPFRGADEIVLETESVGLDEATAELTLIEFPGGAQRKFALPLAREMRFRTSLDSAQQYQLCSLGIHRAQKGDAPWKIGFKSLRGVFRTTRAAALRAVAETGNPLHIVREGKGERPVLSIRNAAQERIAAHGTLSVKGFSGEAFELPVVVALEGGQSVEIPIAGAAKKGVWRIGGELAAEDGSTAPIDTRFAVMTCHEATPRQPKGTFRLGVHWHLPRFTPKDRQLAAAAMVACGAKLARADLAHMSAIQGRGPDTWDFARTDELIETLEANGLAIDAIIFHIPKWAAQPENQTNANSRVWALSRPRPGLFETFCERLAARYGTRIDYYEIGNEWDLRSFFPSGSYEDAVEILREASAGLKRGCPACCVTTCGWASSDSTRDPVTNGRNRIQELVLTHAKDFFDVHAIHCHGSFALYERAIRNHFFPMRSRTGASEKPWFSNETALSSRWSERTAANAVWKKILWAWAHGSVDYVWYNLKGTGWNPKDAEQGYGLITADFFPRDSYVAFAALATVVGGAEFQRKIFDEAGRYWYAFTRKGMIVLTAWHESETVEKVAVKTDASCAWRVDLMGNRTRLPQVDGKVAFTVSSEPCAIILKDASFAEPEATVLGKRTPSAPGTVVIPSDHPGRPPDFTLERPDQVHDFFEANPAEVKRLWQGPKDHSGKVWLSKDPRGLRVRVEVEDDVHCQPYAGTEQHKGDAVQIAIAVPGRPGPWVFGLAHRDDGGAEAVCRIAPKGFDAQATAARIKLKTSRVGTATRYEALLPYGERTGFVEKALEDGVRFNLMIGDNDGDGCDATIEIVPNTFHANDLSRAPIVRFDH